MHIAGEDHGTGENMWIGHDVDASAGVESALDAIVDEAVLRPPASATALMKERAAWTREQLSDTGATGLFSFVREHDDGPLWDYPSQARVARDAGIPSVMLPRQVGMDPAAIAGAIEALTDDKRQDAPA